MLACGLRLGGVDSTMEMSRDNWIPTKRVLILFCLVISIGIVGCRAGANSEVETALLRAARDGHADAVEELVKTPGIDLNVKDDSGDTSLLLAARFGHDHVTRALLAAGADAQLRSKDGKTPLMLAIDGGHEEVVLALREGGAKE